MKLEKLTIEMAENGYTVTCYYKPEKETKGKKGEMVAPMYEEPHTHVFETAGAASTFISEQLGKTPLGKANPGDYRRRRDKGEGEHSEH